MIIVCFGYGLGNQMFQYAFYLAMKQKYPNHVIKMDINNIMEEDHNGFELDKIFGIEKDCCNTWKSVVHSLQYPRNKRFFRVGNKLLILKRKYIRNPHHLRVLDGTIYNIMVDQIPAKGTWLLEGFWTHPDYYHCVEQEIYDAFCFPPIEDGDNDNLRIKSEIENTNSVAIHVRRGDYSAAGLDILGKGYYRKAIDIINKQVDKPVYYVFSDENKEKLEELFSNEEDVRYVSHNIGKNSFRDMQLMTLCKHNIIANSTFSFWGAFLNNNEKKIVIAPKRVGETLKNGYTYPGWQIIDNC